MHIFYIHGFNSSPDSIKARLFGEYLSEHHPDISYHVPKLPFDPDAAIRLLDSAVGDCLEQGVALVGSSLGGFYSTWLASRYASEQIPVVLLNPAVEPQTLLRDYLGENTNIYTGERYTFDERHIASLIKLDVAVPEPNKIWLLVQTGDEVLDYRKALDKYASCESEVIEGGSHGFDHVEQYFARMASFLMT